MASVWQPQEAGLLQICGLLSEVQNAASNQAQILQQLDQYKQYPDFNNYLCFIFAKGEQLSVEVRQSAGLLLKNNLKQQYNALADELRKSITDALVLVMVHPKRALRQTAGTIIAVIVGAAGLGSWPDLVAAVAQCLQSEDMNALDGGLDTLYKMIEDFPMEMETLLPTAGGKHTASMALAPLLLKLMQSPKHEVRQQAVACLNMMARDLPSGLYDNLDTYLQGLFALAHDQAADVRKEVCIGMVQMLAVQPDKLQPFLYQIIEYMLASNEHDDKGVALESCEFWMAFCEAQLEPDLLRPFLPRLIPVLMKNMVFEDEDEDVHDAEAAEASQPKQDSDQEVKPFHHKQREHGADGQGEDDNDDEQMNRWNLRKCSAAGLDRLSTVYGDELLPVLLPIVEQRLQNTDWRARESAILALGAVSEGCHQGLLPYLAAMVAMLLPKLGDPRPMVRIISCWALSRYSHWLLTASPEGASGAGSGIGPGSGVLDSVVTGLLRCVLDHNKYVQEAACSAVATLEEVAANEKEAVAMLQPYLQPILETLGHAIACYSRRNLRLVYDALATLAEAIGQRIAEPQLLQLYMPPLYQKLVGTSPADKDLLPLMECLTQLAVSLGRHFEAYAPAVFEKCMQSLAVQFEARQAASAGQAHPVEYERDAVVCALDLISGMTEGIGASIEPLIGPSGLLQVVVQACRDEAQDVRQSGFALMGDLAKASIGHLAPVAPELVTLALANLEPHVLTQENMKSCNNACWALGEVVIKLPPETVRGSAERIAERAASILLLTTRLPRSIIENSAITLGRVAWICPEQIAPHLGHFFAAWCQALRGVRDDVEKEHAFLGLCRLIRLNPDAAIAGFEHLACAITSWRSIRCEGLRNEVMQIMQALKQSLSAAGRWVQLMASLSAPVQHKLLQMCQL